MKRMIYEGVRQNEISFPLGGLGCGSIGLSGSGRLIDWEIFNIPNKGSDNGHTHFAIRAERADGTRDARVIVADIGKDLTGQHGQCFGTGLSNTTMQGFPHFRRCVFRGEYPIAQLDFVEDSFPGAVALTAYNPLIPLNADDSGLPAAYLTYTVTNTTDKPVTYTVAGVLRNPTDCSQNRFYAEEEMSCVQLSRADTAPEAFEYTDLTLAVPQTEGVVCQEYWYRGAWFDGLETYWRNFTECAEMPARHYEEPGRYDTAVLCSKKTVLPGETAEFPFVLCWNVPNRRNYWDPYYTKNAAGEDVETPMKNYYATRFASSRETARYALANRGRLYAETLKYHDALFSSTLPEEVLDAVSATTSVLKTETAIRIGEAGDFYGWEGLGEHWGSCDGTCTHVWNYAYAMAFLFPDVERNIRENDYHFNQRPDGSMSFRTKIPFGRGIGGFRACVDGQMGGVLKVYREWKISGDNNWLASLWPLVKKSIEFAWSEENADRWDRDRDGVLEGRQHHTLDMELFGPSSWLEGFYLGALKAGAEMADAMGEPACAAEYRALFARGYAWTKENLFNGSYFIQKTALDDQSIPQSFDCMNYWNDEAGEIKYQIGEGCALDQLLAQWHADLLGLGDLFDAEQVHTALGNLFANNYKTDMRSHYNTFRIFALNNEAATIICDYPDGVKKPAIPIPYAQESMHGFEYAFAGLLMSRGYMEEGLRVVRAVRDRYTGDNRNPWNEIECGNNYARSMASFALLPILSGMTFDMTRGSLGFAPKLNRDAFRCVFSLGSAWGEVVMDKNEASLAVHAGQLTLSEVSFAGMDHAQTVTADGAAVPFVRGEDGRFLFAAPITVNESLCVR